MDYRRPILPWIIAAMFFVAAIVFGVLAWYNVAPQRGIVWAIASPAEAAAGIIVIVMKLRHDFGRR